MRKETVVWRWLEENWTRKFAIKQVGKGQISAAKRWRKKLTFSEADVIGNVTYEGLTLQKSTSLSSYGGSLAEPCLLVWYHAIWHFRDLLLCTLRVSRCFSEAVVLRTIICFNKRHCVIRPFYDTQICQPCSILSGVYRVLHTWMYAISTGCRWFLQFAAGKSDEGSYH